MTLEHIDTIIALVAILSGVSLLITILTQMFSDLLSLRGKHLQWGLKTLLENIDPGLTKDADAISKAVLLHPLISDSMFSRNKSIGFFHWRYATVIRFEELIGILKKFGDADIRSLPKGGSEKISPFLRELQKLTPGAEKKVAEIVRKSRGDIEQWFQCTMDRISQHFVMHTRIVTIICSVLIAFLLHLDTFEMLTRFSNDAELRSRLVASADALNQKADEILNTSGKTSSVMYLDAMKQFKTDYASRLNLAEPSGFNDLDTAKAWLKNQLQTQKIPDEDTKVWVERYIAFIPPASLRVRADQLKTILNDKMKSQIIPDPYPKIISYWKPSFRHFLGVLATAMLLSLGAPFWFNMLKTLTNLRPILATKEKNETKEIRRQQSAIAARAGQPEKNGTPTDG
jgi:hypothetical protein